ncbi:hypothetical protein BT69DRAFT_350638 [Atractiella rhizophila]|nr:hypothetical protein BT69DRAFT_350638 [Atractiella rhizophila]
MLFTAGEPIVFLLHTVAPTWTSLHHAWQFTFSTALLVHKSTASGNTKAGTLMCQKRIEIYETRPICQREHEQTAFPFMNCFSQPRKTVLLCKQPQSFLTRPFRRVQPFFLIEFFFDQWDVLEWWREMESFLQAAGFFSRSSCFRNALSNTYSLRDNT